MNCDLTVIVPTHNPDPGRLARTLRALQRQTLATSRWECLVVDNASTPGLQAADWTALGPPSLRLIAEPAPGLSHARRRGFLSGGGNVFVLVDDDNELAPDYLAEVLDFFARYPRAGVVGGRSVPEFEAHPPGWMREFDGLLALRDLGDQVLVSSGLRNPATGRNDYPGFAPIGAGMALRRAATKAWLERAAQSRLPDRQGGRLSSGGDNDLVLCAMASGWEAAYNPALTLTHLIPAFRTNPEYLARLNLGIQESWMQVLAMHHANPWPPLSPMGAKLRQIRAWFAHRAWSSPAAHIRWQGACGHFAGRVAD